MSNNNSFKNLKPWKKGQSGNPKGRPPVLLPEVQEVIDSNRNTLKITILQELEKEVVPWLKRIIEQGRDEGDVVRFKTLLEIALGKLVYDPPEFEPTEEERNLITWFRKRNENERQAKALAQQVVSKATDCPVNKKRGHTL